MGKTKEKPGMYAQGTKVSVPRSVEEIERTLKKYKATDFEYLRKSDAIGIGFTYQGRQVRMIIEPMPRDQKLIRQRYRALLLMMKAKLEAIHIGVTTMEKEFMAHLVLLDGSTMAERLLPQIASGQLPLLPPGKK